MTAANGRFFLIMLAAVVALAAGETALSKAMKQTAGQESGWTVQLKALCSSGWFIAGLVLVAAHLVLYLIALRRADLSLAMPLTAASYPLAALLARFYLGENMGPARWIGTVVVTVGVAIFVFAEAGSATDAKKLSHRYTQIKTD
jgi:drug/metabolite transporter (DMT)-like permease